MKTTKSTQRRGGAESKVQSPMPKAEHPGDYDLLAVQLFRIGRAAASLVDKKFENQGWAQLSEAVCEGWHAVARHVFFNYDLKTNAGWKSVSVEMPDDEIIVLIYAENARTSEPVWMAYHEGGVWKYPDTVPVNGSVTHWMHFPEPPSVPRPSANSAGKKGYSK